MKFKTENTVRSLAGKLSVWPQIIDAIQNDLSSDEAARLLDMVAQLPVRRSRATRSLGAYVSKAGKAFCIRLQFVLELEELKETFLHELAHACDHLVNQPGQPYRQAHGPGWKTWAKALGSSGDVRGQSRALSQRYRDRLKLVAICGRCGAEFQRVRRLNHRQKYFHRDCGGQLNPL